MPVDAKSIFLAAADKPAAERAAYLDTACAGDAVLRQRVEALLRAHDEPSVSPMTGPYAPAAPAPEELAPLFPQLEVLELLGAGGMGAVY